MAVFDNRISVNKVTLDDTQRLTCVIEAAENAQDHTVYLMRVQRGPFSDTSFQVWRRYSDFVSLHAYLQAAQVPELVLPPKKVFGKMDREFVAERQQGLQNYINTVLLHPLLSSTLPVKRFFDPNNYDINFLEKALQDVSMVFRSESHWEVVEPLPDLGWRLRKHYFLVKPKVDPKERLLLYWVPFGPDKFLENKDIQTALKLLRNVEHPYLCPSSYSGATDSGGVNIREFHSNGSLRDLICKCKPKGAFIKKYATREQIGTAIPQDAIKKFGKQILVSLKFLHDKGFSHGHLHLGNILVVNDKCRLLDVENQLFGLPSFYRPFYVQLKKVQTLENIDVYSFGHLLYEMTFGEPARTATCDFFPASCPAELRSVLEATLTTEACRNGLPSIANLLLHPFFSNGNSNDAEAKVVFKVPSQLKESLKRARGQMEGRLQEEQRALRHNQRVSRAQLQLTSAEQKKKRPQERRKKTPTEVRSNGTTSNGPSPTPPITPSVRPLVLPTTLPLSMPPVPPPPPPPPTPSTPLEGVVPLPAFALDRTALFGSIENFNANKLKKTTTKDSSIPKL